MNCNFNFTTKIEAKGLDKEDVSNRLLDICNFKIISSLKSQHHLKDLKVKDIKVIYDFKCYEIEVFWEGSKELNYSKIPTIESVEDTMYILEDMLFAFRDITREYFKTTSFLLSSIYNANIIDIV